MDIKNICLCCLRCPADRNMKTPYIHFGKTEIYSDMLKECFEIHPTKLLSDDERKICEACIGCLRNAYNFKRQVLHSQAELQRLLHKEQVVKQEESSMKLEPELSGNDEELINFSHEVKVEIPDPLPSVEVTYNEFEVTIETQNLTSDACKQEPTFELKLEQPSYPKPKEEIITAGIRKNKPKRCTTCGENFANKALLVSHKQIHNTCTICNKQFKYKSRLKKHNLTFCHRNSYVCGLCNKQFERKSDLNRHELVHLSENPFSCDKCDKKFTDVSYLNIHKSTHKERTYVCDICQAKFLRKHVLIGHIGRHQGIKHFSCGLCSKRFWDYSRLFAHQESHTDKIYQCDECAKVFTYRKGIADHLKTHVRPYSCIVCTRIFSTYSSLRRHEVVHTDDRPFSCELCHKSFRQKQHLSNHRLTHTEDRPHCCETCGKRFSQKRNLKTHLQTHMKGNFCCELCTKSYSTKEGLRQHRRTHMRNKFDAKLERKSTEKERNTDY